MHTESPKKPENAHCNILILGFTWFYLVLLGYLVTIRERSAKEPAQRTGQPAGSGLILDDQSGLDQRHMIRVMHLMAVFGGVEAFCVWVIQLDSPVFTPILTQYLNWVLCSSAAVSAAQIICRTKFVATPTNSFREGRLNRKFLCQDLLHLK